MDSGEEDFYIADLHLGYWTDRNPQRKAQYDRTFSSHRWGRAQNYDSAVVRNWNQAVGPDDTVWMLGDVSNHDLQTTVSLLRQLNGRKRLVVGNHDLHFLHSSDFRRLFAEIRDYKEQRLPDGRKLVLCHYPMWSWNGRYAGNPMFHGHVHDTQDWTSLVQAHRRLSEQEPLLPEPMSLNVGAMMPWMDFRPQRLSTCLRAAEGQLERKDDGRND